MSTDKPKLLNSGVLKEKSLKQLRDKWGISIVVSFISNMILSIPIIILSMLLGFFLAISLVFISSSNNDYSFTVFLIIYLIFILIILVTIILFGPIIYTGLFNFFNKISKGETADISDFFYVFRNFKKIIALGLMVFLRTILWSLLFVIPGIIASYRYSQVYLILLDEPDLSVSEIINKSSKMMDGAKVKYFLLLLSFIGWGILSSFSVIGVYFLLPYLYTTYINFYENLKENTF